MGFSLGPEVWESEVESLIKMAVSFEFTLIEWSFFEWYFFVLQLFGTFFSPLIAIIMKKRTSSPGKTFTWTALRRKKNSIWQQQRKECMEYIISRVICSRRPSQIVLFYSRLHPRCKNVLLVRCMSFILQQCDNFFSSVELFFSGMQPILGYLRNASQRTQKESTWLTMKEHFAFVLIFLGLFFSQ